MSAKPLFASLFGKSPIQPIHDHLDECVATAALLPGFFDCVLEGNWQATEAMYDRIAEAEERADALKKSVRLSLPRTLFLPFARDDLLELLAAQDHVANAVKDVAGLVLGRRMTFPESMHEELNLFVGSGVTAVRLLSDSAGELSSLIQGGFSGHKIDALKSIIEKLEDAESEADNIERMLRRKLFALESDLPSVDALFMYQTIELIGEIADSAQLAGDRLIQLLGN